MKRLVLIIIIFNLLISACTADFPGISSDSIVSFSFPEIDKSYYNSLLNEFKLIHPEIKIELLPTPLDKINEQEGEVQVLSSYTFTDYSPWKISRYESLRNILEEETGFNNQDFFPGALEAFTSRNQTLAIPYGIDPFVVFYNWDLFIKNKVVVPNNDWNLDNFITTAAKLTNRDQDIFGYSPRSSYIDSLLFIYQHSGRIIDNDNKPSLNINSNIEALNWYARLFQILNVAVTPQKAASYRLGLGTFEDGIIKGKIGMWIGKFSERGGQGSTTTWDFNWGILPVPSDVKAITLGHFEAYAISRQANNISQCWEWIKFLSQQTHPRLLPARPSLADEQKYRRSIGLGNADVATSAALNLYWVKNTNAGNFNNALNPLLEAVTEFVTQGSTPEEALSRVLEKESP